VVALFLPPWLTALGALAFLSLPVFGFVVHRRLGQRFLPTLLIPFGQLVMIYVLLRSTWICVRQGGIVWRGTHYSTQDLKRLQRVKL
jgi:hypothetical protein